MKPCEIYRIVNIYVGKNRILLKLYFTKSCGSSCIVQKYFMS